ncbi:MAG: MBL fold metallo-hydrolase, partial [Candidatus Eremiobacteraeota bacterium]|nr:MBL fold metallo-hydrolase [Candidatus Eremiobacteraeota bacterium]
GVSKLVLTHYPAGIEPQALVDAAKRRFAGSVIPAQDGLTLEL